MNASTDKLVLARRGTHRPHVIRCEESHHGMGRGMLGGAVRPVGYHSLFRLLIPLALTAARHRLRSTERPEARFTGLILFRSAFTHRRAIDGAAPTPIFKSNYLTSKFTRKRFEVLRCPLSDCRTITTDH